MQAVRVSGSDVEWGGEAWSDENTKRGREWEVRRALEAGTAVSASA